MTDAVFPQQISDPAAALAALRHSLLDCRLCGLCQGRTQVVFGTGSPTAALMFVGEGPGFHEDRQGEPFVGQAGKLLTTLLGQIGLTRADVYIANVVKCRPPENRDPTEEEISACSPHLMQQIAIIRPRVICTLGRFATHLLADTGLSMTVVHGKAKVVEFGGLETVIFPVFHPAAALYTPANRKVLEEDFLKLRRLIDGGAEALRLGAPDKANGTDGPAAMEQVADHGGRAGGGPAEPMTPEPGLRPSPRAEREREEQLHLW